MDPSTPTVLWRLWNANDAEARAVLIPGEPQHTLTFFVDDVMDRAENFDDPRPGALPRRRHPRVAGGRRLAGRARRAMIQLEARHRTVPVRVGAVTVGGGAPVVVQSMTMTDTADAASTARQCVELWEAGSEMVRVTVNVPDAAAAVPEIKRACSMPAAWRRSSAISTTTVTCC